MRLGRGRGGKKEKEKDGEEEKGRHGEDVIKPRRDESLELMR